MKKLIPAVLFLGCILAANYVIAHVGTPTPGGPHVLPVGFGLSAPSGVYVVGLTLVLRDLLQRQVKGAITFALILVGAALTYFIAPNLAFASGAAFLISESVDFAVFSLARRFGDITAVVLSNAVSIAVDSWVFLTIAFGSTAFLEGQILGKAEATLAAVTVLLALHIRSTRQEVLA